jgi:hypothetical protein
MADETKNVNISVEDRFNTELGSIAIDWPGADLDTDPLVEWLAPDLLGFSSSPSRKVQRTELYTLSVNCFHQAGEGRSTSRVWELVDLVRAAFDQHDLAVLDWAQADPKPTLFYLRFSEGTVERINPPPDAGRFLQQLNVTFDAFLVA